ncbi:non-canonical purine NTP pyrophosphatase [Candidatus Woesearchaeota archaeon CG10_big_fil_rev_8_21_14_0_10_44_13]|nr:MAG: non-canonical purine NTP pyrophosphatase [Candidatus Woesearchaeota archaeon CG10_big_fil_rev_8_21_14_0_10_44_13]
MPIKKLFFATSNRHKFEEVSRVFSKWGIELEQADIKFKEDKTKTIQGIAAECAKSAAEKLKKPVIVDDTGIFFVAMENWPGNSPNDVFQQIGYDGLLKALEGKTREAYFETAAAYCEPGQEPVVFTDRLEGTITHEVFGVNKDTMPYNRIFIAKGFKEPNVFLAPEVKEKISHRTKAFMKLAEYVSLQDKGENI